MSKVVFSGLLILFERSAPALGSLFALSGLPNANAKSQRFSNAISQIATLPPVVALNRNSRSQIAARAALRFGTQFPKSHWRLSFSAPKSQRLQDANATKSQTLAFSHLFSRARKKDSPFFPVGRPRPEPSPKPSPCKLPFLYKKE